MIIKVDPHTHTLASGHAFSTIEENAIHAKERQLEAIAMTDHYGFGANPSYNFGPAMNMDSLPKVIHGVRVLAGTEIDIVDLDGNLAGYNVFTPSSEKSLGQRMLESREVTIASVHFFEGMHESTIAQNTQMYCNVARNPYVNIIGHIGRAGLPFDIDEVLLAAKESATLIEINEHSFDFDESIMAVCRNIALRCAELGVEIAVGSDAHSAFFVGEFGRVQTMLKEIDFPQELIANLTLDKFLGVLAKKRR